MSDRMLVSDFRQIRDLMFVCHNNECLQLWFFCFTVKIDNVFISSNILSHFVKINLTFEKGNNRKICLIIYTIIYHREFENPDYKHETVLSTHIWECKARGSAYKVSWRILDRGQPFNPVTKICKLCVRERFYILRKPHLASLNHRQEIGTFCPHIRSSLLRNVKKVKAPD